jgi:hypothetical protein
VPAGGVGRAGEDDFLLRQSPAGSNGRRPIDTSSHRPDDLSMAADMTPIGAIAFAREIP